MYIVRTPPEYHSNLARLIRSIDSEYGPVIEKLKQIPHLELPCDIDVDAMLEEINLVPNWVGLVAPPFRNYRQETKDQMYEYYKGQALVDAVEDEVIGMTDFPDSPEVLRKVEFDEYGLEKCFPTKTGRELKSCLSAIHQLSSNPQRSRIVKTAPGGELRYHDHHDGENFYITLVVHFPLVTNPHVIHTVQSADGREFPAHYEVGKVYLFNCWARHKFGNHGKEDRLSIVARYASLDREFMDNIQETVERYDGPLYPIQSACDDEVRQRPGWLGLPGR